MRRWTSDSVSESDSVGDENPLSPSSVFLGSVGSVLGVATATHMPFEENSRGGSSLPREGENTPAISSSPVESEPKKMRIAMEFGDEYFGEVKMDRGTMIPHGHGTLRSVTGKHCYVGGFVNRGREGEGKLTTERYVLWSKWKMNRPDLTSSARIDYADGSKYYGFLFLRQDSVVTAPHLSWTSKTRLSKFSTWVQMTTPVRERWGEFVAANGDRYFGQWERDLPSGFGCLVTSRGDRYVGLFEEGKFHDTGVLFSLSYGRRNDGNYSLLGGAYSIRTRCTEEGGEGGGNKENEDELDIDPKLDSTPTITMRDVEKERWNGVVFDGVWEKGRFVSEGYVTLPCGSRISAEWKSSTHPTNGRVFLGCFHTRTEAGMNARGWFQCFHWEPLLCGACEELKAKEYSACASYRERLSNATTQEEIQAILGDFCSNEAAVKNGLKLFRRCFYFLHGTCGKSSEIGSGLDSNRLGWCYLRRIHGGCIHRRDGGRPISVGDVDLAMTDIISFVRSVGRWVVAMLGDVAVADNSSEMFVARRVLDYVLRDTHDVLFNLYLHAFREEDLALSVALERLREHTTLDDMGVVFARQQSEEQLFDPYADAIHGIEQLEGNVHTFTGKLRVLAQWPREIDLAARLAQVSLDDKSCSLLPRRHSMHLELGSADDLLPIYQYVLIKAKLRHLYVHSKLLVDLSSEDMFVEFASPENFFVTTLHACTVILAGLNPLLRDKDQVLVSYSFFEEQLRSAVYYVKHMATSFLDIFPSVVGEMCAVQDAEELHDIAVGYLKAWLPTALDVLSTQICTHTVRKGRVVHVTGLLNSTMTRKLSHLHEPQCPRSVALFCWLAAAHIVSVLKLGLGIVMTNQRSDSVDVLLVEAEDVAVFLKRYSQQHHNYFHHQRQGEKKRRSDTDGRVVFLLNKPLQPFFLHFAASTLLVAL